MNPDINYANAAQVFAVSLAISFVLLCFGVWWDGRKRLDRPNQNGRL